MRFGWKPDSGRIPRKLLAAAVNTTGTPVGWADLRSHAPRVLSQNACGSCVGHGAATGIATAADAAGACLFGLDADDLTVACSPRDLYAGARCTDRMLAGLPNTTPLSDDGTEVLSVVQYAREWGVRAIGPMPMRAVDPVSGDAYDADSDCVPSNVNDEPTFAELQTDSANLLPEPHQIVSSGPQRVTEYCLALDAKHPIVFGTLIDSNFLRYTGGTVIGAQNRRDPDGGGHCMVLLGYRTDPATGKRIFIGRNSWGTGWGNSGDFECSEEFVKQIDEAFAIVGRAS
jgi:hypothetical protein